MLGIFLGYYLLFHYSAKVISQIPVVSVNYVDTGYNPDYIEVPKGTLVLFLNHSSYPMWTASDPHPVHTDYSVFDAKKSYGTGEIFPFFFKETGTYAWHNHEKSDHRGIVRVYDPKNPLLSIDKTKKELRETRDKFLAMLDPRDDTTVGHMIDTLEADTKLSRNCHDMAHDLGHRAYEYYGFSRAMTFGTGVENTSVDDICAGGYMHGILEELFLHHKELQKTPEKVCASVNELHKGSCYHGVGHGVMFAMKRNISNSLASCRTISNQTYVYRCFEGVWMEMFWGDTGHAGADSLGWNQDRPFDRCIKAEQDEKPTCFLYAHLGYLRYHSGDFTGVIRFCTASNLTDSDKQFCLKGVGITMMKHFTSHHLDKTEGLVKNLSYNQKFSYYQGVLGYSILSNVPRASLAGFCEKLLNDTNICKEALKTQ
ncbi:MAG: hypothetical protein HHAS10_08500 [Candidatus Altimarinota bacterium]